MFILNDTDNTKNFAYCHPCSLPVSLSIVAAWLLFFVIFLRYLPISILLCQSGGELMSLALWLLLEHATSGKSAAYAVMQSAMILVIVVLFQFVTRARATGVSQ